VFKLRDDRAEMDTAVSVLVDMSGSMKGPKASLATQAVIAIAEALDRPSIPFEVLGFNNASMFLGVSGRAFEEIEQDHREKRHDRYVPLDMYELKRFDERLSQASGVLWQIERLVDGSNSDGEAVLSAWRRLLARPESRRVMLVLSDGQPATSGNKGAQANYLGDVVRRVEADESCDVVGIGIMDASVEEFYQRSVVVNDIDELAGVAMDQMARLLMGERFVVDNRKLGS
jgi:cobaltochelatase CobT